MGSLPKRIALVRVAFVAARDAAAHQIAQVVDRRIGDPVVDVRAAVLAVDQAVLGQMGEMARDVGDAAAAGLGQFADAARHAVEAGFDGVEIHAANGYLIDQFLRDGSNQRTDAYGGSLENRARFLREVLAAVTGAIGAGRVGVRLSPLNSYNDMKDSDPVGLITYPAKMLDGQGLAYLHVMRADFFGVQKADVETPAREHFKGVLVGNMGYGAEEGEAAVASGRLDAVAFGTGFLANPDLPERFRTGAALNTPDQATFYTPGAAGYTDYPSMS